MSKVELDSNAGDASIAVIGMSGRFPGAANVEQFFRSLCDGIESISRFTEDELRAAGVSPELYEDPRYVKVGRVVEGAETFDAGFFGMSAREAELMDPQQRVFLECAWEAMELAGYDAEQLDGVVGVYAGVSMNRYLLRNLVQRPDIVEAAGLFQTMIVNDKDFLATRVSYKLNLRGPSVGVQTACSTSLVAIHLACQSLVSGECDMALAGGVSINMPQKTGYLYQEGGIFSPDGRCRAFDASAGGTTGGNGAGVVVLKRLSDALADGDCVHAVIRGSAINNDGALKAGYTAPSADGQEAVICEAHAVAGVTADTISYVEAHGTGTLIGDPIEIAALSRAFRAGNAAKGTCAIGSVKTNIGHLDIASGVAGFIKTVMAMKHALIPPSLHFEVPNPAISFEDSPFFVNATLRPWPRQGTPRRAGVSSFGIGGTNAHVILEEAPAVAPSRPGRPQHLLTISAKTASALDAATENLRAHLDGVADSALPDIAYTLQVGRRAFAHRRVLRCRSVEEARAALASRSAAHVRSSIQESRDRPVVFLFPGQGAQHVGMAAKLYQSEPVFREHVDHCARLLEPDLGLDLRAVLWPEGQATEDAARRLGQTALAQPSLFVIEYCVAQLLMDWGIHPQAMIGHSIGEYVAACVSGVFSLEDALSLVAARGRMMQALPAGAMLAVPLPEPDARRLVGRGMSLAAVNGPALSVLAGPKEPLQQLMRQLAAQGIETRLLHTSHAFHSEMMEPVLEPFTRAVQAVRLGAPRIRYLSNLTGTTVTPALATSPRYWADHLRGTVRFADGLRELLAEPEHVFVEVGPGQTLSSLVRQQPGAKDRVVVASLGERGGDDAASVVETVGQLWLSGLRVDWASFQARDDRRRVPLPTYPFERQRYYVEPAPLPGLRPAARSAPRKRPELSEWLYTPSWKRRELPSADVPPNGRWWLFMDECGLGEELARRIELEGGLVTRVLVGAQAGRDGNTWWIRPAELGDYEGLLQSVDPAAEGSDTMVHLWSVTPRETTAVGPESFERAQRLGFSSLLCLAQALGRQRRTTAVRLVVVSSDIHEVVGDEPIRPEKATVLGPCKVIPQEYPHVTCQSVDLSLPCPGGPQAEAMVNRLWLELTSRSSDRCVAYRGGHRWVQTFEPCPTDSPSARMAPRLRQEGVYLITGGLGKVGSWLAEHLARVARARLVLCGRTALPPRDQWERWRSSHGDEDAVSRRILTVQGLEALGAEVLPLTVDVADPEQVQDAIQLIRARFGALHGVIHAAGLTGEGSVQPVPEWSPDRGAQQFRPKVYGALALERALRGQEFDFCLCTSSLSAVLGGLGFAAYAAANLFLDAMAIQMNQARPGRWISIDFDAFQRDGGALQMARGQLAELAMTPAEGVEMVRRVLALRAPSQVVVSTADLASRLEQWIQLERPGAREGGQVEAVHLRPEIATAYVAPRSELENTIAAVCGQLLGLDKVGVSDSFFDLGAHSLLAAQFAAKLGAALGREVSVRAILQNPSVGALAVALGAAEAVGSPVAPTLSVAAPLLTVPSTPTSEAPPPSERGGTRVERRPLLSLFAAGQIAPVASAALGYLPAVLLQQTGLSRDEIVQGYCGDLPVVSGIFDTHLGRIASIILPRFAVELYQDPQDAVARVIDALELAGRLGAHDVSLTGIIPSATDYGRAIAREFAGRTDLPRLSTGHATTSAAVVLSIKKLVASGGRALEREQVGFVGLGSVGLASLRLMLTCLPHPKVLTLCDVYSKRSWLDRVHQEVVEDFGFRGRVNIAESRAEVPSAIYEASVIVGATNVPGIVDVAKLRPGTLIIDDSSPHCFDRYRAIARLRAQGDILFTEGGMLKSPEPIDKLMYIPSIIPRSEQLDAALSRDSSEIFGCIFSSLLSSRLEGIEPTLGLVGVHDSVRHYRVLAQLGFDAAELHCEEFVLPTEAVESFRRRFGAAMSSIAVP